MRPHDIPYRRPPPHMHPFHPPGGQGPPRGHFGPPRDHGMHRQMPPRGGFPMQPNLPPRGYGGPGGPMQYPPEGDRMRFPPPPGGILMPPHGDGERKVSPPGEAGPRMTHPSERAAHPLPPGEMYEPSRVTSPDSEKEAVTPVPTIKEMEGGSASIDYPEEAVEEVEMDDVNMSLDEEDKEPSRPTQELEQVPSGSGKELAEDGSQDMVIDSQDFAPKSPQEPASRSPEECALKSSDEPAPQESTSSREFGLGSQESVPKSLKHVPQESAFESNLISPETAQKCQLDSSVSTQDEPAPSSELDSLDSSDIDAMLDNIPDRRKIPPPGI